MVTGCDPWTFLAVAGAGPKQAFGHRPGNWCKLMADGNSGMAIDGNLKDVPIWYYAGKRNTVSVILSNWLCFLNVCGMAGWQVDSDGYCLVD